MKRFLLCTFLMSAYCIAQGGGVYKWVDESGQVHFTDKPPAGQSVESHAVRSASREADIDTYSSGLRPGEIDRLNQVQQQESLEADEKQRAHQEYQRRIAAEDDRKRRECESAKKQASYYADKLHTGCDGGACDYYKLRREDYEHKAFDACR